MKNSYKLICLALPFLLTSCIKEGFDKENCPGEFILIPTTPGESGDKAELKGTVTKFIDATGKEHEVEAGSGKPIDLEDGDYTVVTVKDAEDGQVNVDGTTISVVTQPDGTAGEPGSPIGGHTHITVGKDGNNGEDGTRIEIPTNYQSRPLILKVHFEGENTSLIRSIAGVVDGIALSRDLNHGFTPTDGQDRHPAITTGSVNYSFDADQEAAGSYQGIRTLLGISGDESQTFTMTVTYEGDVQKIYTFDITHRLDGFHTQDVTSPWVIEITLRLGADFIATIEDWKAGPESWMEAH